jgi:hypothetical protein
MLKMTIADLSKLLPRFDAAGISRDTIRPLAIAIVIGVSALVPATPALAAAKEDPKSPPPPPAPKICQGVVENVTRYELVVRNDKGDIQRFAIGETTAVLRDGKPTPVTGIRNVERVSVEFAVIKRQFRGLVTITTGASKSVDKKNYYATRVCVGSGSDDAQSKTDYPAGAKTPNLDRGIVRNVTGGELLIASENGKSVRYAIDSNTKIFREGKPITVGGVGFNEPVSVEFAMIKSVRGKKAYAVKIHVGGIP